MLTIYKYGNSQSSTVLIQPVGDHDLPLMEEERKEIQKLTGMDIQLVAVEVNNWNHDLSPWAAPAVFGNEAFGNGATETLSEILKLCEDASRRYYIGGYSMAGLFSLWAVCKTDKFAGVAAASPSVWFPGFLEYLKKQKIQSKYIYLSLGDKEEKTRNSVMAQVGSCIRTGYTWMKKEGICCTLEWTRGGHFKEPGIRTARAFAWVLKQNVEGKNE